MKEYRMTNYSYNPSEKPGLVTAIGVLTLISGIVNIFWGLAASMTALATIIGIVCVPLAILPTILGVFEIIYAIKLLGATPQPVQPSTAIAVLEIICILAGNVFSAVVGILSLVFYNDPAVKNYFARLNEVPAPSVPVPAATETAPVQSTSPEPQPDSANPAPEEPILVDGVPEVKPEATDKKPRRSRKAA